MSKECRNMWIGDRNPDRHVIMNMPRVNQELGSTALVAADAEPVATEDSVELDQSPLAKAGKPLDDLVPRSWKSWE